MRRSLEEDQFGTVRQRERHLQALSHEFLARNSPIRIAVIVKLDLVEGRWLKASQGVGVGLFAFSRPSE